MAGLKNSKDRMKRDRDSLFTHFLARTVSIRITPQIAKTAIFPLHVTLAGLFVGLLAAWQASQSNWINFLIAAIFIETAHIFDCIDGELARLTNRGNPFAAAMDPITDRIKDIFIIFASLIQAVNASIFGWQDQIIYKLAFFTVSIWTFYMYIVDAFLNPKRKKKGTTNRIYIGLYDLFIYGAIFFLLLDIFEYFIIYVFSMSTIGGVIQIFRLRKFSKEL
ncbi:hypothetical protein DSCA_11460 [Desulfosarcina alkanivorans]|uniref:CDP-alcohol phosphatidyltransferase n=1 Tax=Desulfosarcina alkanivorans TaxID=571177 RepID=A0A5K7YDY0_9BACT|nr:CDP-alcohol phosphatidyltransferase family protein [Desulfosarcina alkanivorans]BBO67216.1 hypothetical protein DSCA_11460 [Desulfosarcina alkanivorans]